LIGFTIVQFSINLPLVLLLFWILGTTLTYHAPIIPH
jgi:short-chain fatty acids transporter